MPGPFAGLTTRALRANTEESVEASPHGRGCHMSPRLAVWLGAFGLALGGCQKLPERDANEVTFPPKSMAGQTSIPLEFGELVGVVPGARPGWALLFFERPNKSIVALYVNAGEGILGRSFVEFPRH